MSGDGTTTVRQDSTPMVDLRFAYPHEWCRAFIAALRKTGSVRGATKAVGIDRGTAYHARKTYPRFAEAWQHALEDYAEWLERAADRRAVTGVVKFKFDRKGDPLRHPLMCECGHTRAQHDNSTRCQETDCACECFKGEPYYELEYSDTLLLARLRALRPEAYGGKGDKPAEPQRIDVNVSGTVEHEHRHGLAPEALIAFRRDMATAGLGYLSDDRGAEPVDQERTDEAG